MHHHTANAECGTESATVCESRQETAHAPTQPAELEGMVVQKREEKIVREKTVCKNKFCG